MEIFLQLIDCGFNLTNSVILLTPLTGAMNSRKNMQKITMELKISIPDVIKVVNCSSMSFEHNLSYRVMAAALVCLIRNEKVMCPDSSGIFKNRIRFFVIV